jgi:hypothetical protein
MSSGVRVSNQPSERNVLVWVALLTLIVLVLTVNVQFFDSNLFAMTGAMSLLSGDLPFRDFFEPGGPLAAFAAAGTQLLTGQRLIGEFLRQWALIVAGTVIACHLGLELSRSAAAVLALLPVTLLMLANEPTYHYPKLFLFPLMIWAGWRYLDRPGPPRAAVLGLISAIGFLERHDFGVYLGFASVVAFVLARAAVPSSRAPRALVRDAAAYAGAVLVITAPWLIVVQKYEGLLEYSRARAQLYQGSHPIYAFLFRLDPVFDLIRGRVPDRELAAQWLRLMVLLLPVALIASAVTTMVRAARQAAPVPGDAWKRVFAGVFLAALAEALIRQATYVIVVLPVSAALASAFLVSRFLIVRAITAALVVASTVLVALASARSPLLQPLRYPDEIAKAFRRLTDSPPTYPAIEFEYLRRCTRPTDHVLVAGNNPLHVSYFAQRPIAGGQINWHRRWMSDPQHEQLALALLKKQSVPIVFSLGVPAMNDFAAYPSIAGYLRTHYRTIEGAEEQILVDRRREPTGRFAPTGYPCFS